MIQTNTFIQHKNEYYVITSSGTWTCPTGWTKVRIEAWGGGGNGYSVTPGSTTHGGDYARLNEYDSIPGITYTLMVASQSIGGGDLRYLTKASPSWFSSSALLYAAGGGTTSASIGDVIYKGGDINPNYGVYPGGGGSAYRYKDGDKGIGGPDAYSSYGGIGYGAGGTGSGDLSFNKNGQAPGGGGGNGPSLGGISQAGNGARGQIIITKLI